MKVQYLRTVMKYSLHVRKQNSNYGSRIYSDVESISNDVICAYYNITWSTVECLAMDVCIITDASSSVLTRSETN